jgi:hypothetical protein
MANRRIERESLEYIDCEIPQDMTLREWRDADAAPSRPRRLRAAAAALGRAARLRRRA